MKRHVKALGNCKSTLVKLIHQTKTVDIGAIFIICFLHLSTVTYQTYVAKTPSDNVKYKRPSSMMYLPL